MSFTLSSPFAAISGDQIENLAESTPEGTIPNDDLVFDGFAASDSDTVYEVEDLDTLSALEKYCRSDMPAQRLVYAAGIGAAATGLEPSAVSGSLVSLLRELLADVYADVRLTALQQTTAVARRLRSAGMLYQSDIEMLWDLVQPLLLDADVEVQESAAVVLADLSHLVAWGNGVAASQKLVWAVQRLQRVPADVMTEGATAALRLITQVVAPREGSPLHFSSIQDFALTIFKDMGTTDKSADVRQAAALLLPSFVRHMPTSARTSFLPGLLKALAQDSHWNVRAEVPEVLTQLLAVTQQQHHQQQQGQLASSNTSPSSSSTEASADKSNVPSLLRQPSVVRQGSGLATSTSAPAEELSAEERRVICDIADRLCRDSSHQVKVPALVCLGRLLPLLPPADAAAVKPPLLSIFASTAKPAAVVSGVRVPHHLCAPRLSKPCTGRQQQQRAKASFEQQQQQQQQDGRNHAEQGDAGAADAQQLGQPQQHVARRLSAAVLHGTAASELPLACAYHIGKVARHVGPAFWPVLQPAFITLAAAAATAADGDPDIAAALLLSFPDLAAALGPAATRSLLVPVVMELLHSQLDRLSSVLSAMCYNIMAAVPADLRICLLQLMPSLASQTVREMAGDWRSRLAVAEQLPQVATLLTPAQVAYCVWPLLLTLAKDPVHAVRAAAAGQMGKVLLLLPDCELTPQDSMGEAAAAAAAAGIEKQRSAAITYTNAALAAAGKAAGGQVQSLSSVMSDFYSQHQQQQQWQQELIQQQLDLDPVTQLDSLAAAIGVLDEDEQQQDEDSALAAAGRNAPDPLSSSSTEQQDEQQDEQQHLNGPLGSLAAAVGVEDSGSWSDEDPQDLRDPSPQQQQQQGVGGVQLGNLQQKASHLDSLAAAVGIDDDDDDDDDSGLAADAAGGADSDEAEVQQQQLEKGRQVLGRMKRGLLTSLQQLQDGLQQGVDMMKEHKATQIACAHVDRKIQWLQQQQPGSMLRNIGQKLSAAAGAAGATYPAGSGSGSGSFSVHSSSNSASAANGLGPLGDLLESTLQLLSDTVDPCRFLPTPAWYDLAVDLEAFCKAGNSSERQVFVIAAASILAARQQQIQEASITEGKSSLAPDQQQEQQQQTDVSGAVGKQQQQQKQQGSTQVHLQQLLQQLRQLESDPVPGVRSRVAALAGDLLQADSSTGTRPGEQQQQQGPEMDTAPAPAAADAWDGLPAAAGAGPAKNGSDALAHSASTNSGYTGTELPDLQQQQQQQRRSGDNAAMTTAAAAGDAPSAAGDAPCDSAAATGVSDSSYSESAGNPGTISSSSLGFNSGSAGTNGAPANDSSPNTDCAGMSHSAAGPAAVECTSEEA